MGETAVKERPILFSGPMVRAILAGRKTQTRRIFKLPRGCAWYSELDGENGGYWIDEKHPEGWWHVSEMGCPYGIPGDRLWVKETWGVNEHGDEPGVVYKATDPDWQTMTGWKWRPSIFMRRTASRITLEITAVCAERLHDITEEDAVREGFNECSFRDGRGVESARHGFKSLWGHLNGEDSWNSNPWVWCVSFKTVAPAHPPTR